ncbi:MAG: ogr/Delta-like zinc finger family protein [Methylosarcina sp.]
MQLKCPHCLTKARITSRNNLNEARTVADLYCECTDQDCQARFVFTLGFKHYINPPASTTLELAQNLINSLSKDEKTQLLKNTVKA